MIHSRLIPPVLCVRVHAGEGAHYGDLDDAGCRSTVPRLSAGTKIRAGKVWDSALVYSDGYLSNIHLGAPTIPGDAAEDGDCGVKILTNRSVFSAVLP
jgi:hypothetical protein